MISEKQNFEYCSQHDNQILFICRNEYCLRENDFLLCGDQCLTKHFQHGKDLVSYALFQEFIPSFYATIKRNDLALGVCVRQTMNKLLHIKMSMIQLLDSQIEIVKKMVKTQREMPSLKDCIYLIKEVNLTEEYIEFDAEEFEKEVKESLRKTLSRLKRNADSILKKGLDISEISQQSLSQSINKFHTQRQYQIKLEGAVNSVIRQLNSIPEHVTRLKLYLNQDTYGQAYVY